MTLLVEQRGAVLHVRLNRPEVHNALDGDLIAALGDCLSRIEPAHTRALVLAGEGPSFCAGADLTWLRSVRDWSHDEHVADAGRLFDMLSALDSCPVPTVARVHGAALGGGMGLIACCDVVVAAQDARFGFTEAKLGLLPAVISPFAIAKIGAGHARALFATAERFDAARAEKIGLVHHVVPAADLDDAVETVADHLLSSAPGAAAGARHLIGEVAGKPLDRVREYVVAENAWRRTGPEGQEGMAAFLEKRRPSWTKDR